MAQQGKKRLDDKLLMALACGGTVDQAAQAAGLSKRTAYRRLKNPDFRRRLTELRTDMATRTSGLLIAAGGEFVKTLMELAKPTAPAAVRLGAARAGLELGIRTRESVELEARVAALEQQMNPEAQALSISGGPSDIAKENLP